MYKDCTLYDIHSNRKITVSVPLKKCQWI